jgi:hypothetical protein
VTRAANIRMTPDDISQCADTRAELQASAPGAALDGGEPARLGGQGQAVGVDVPLPRPVGQTLAVSRAWRHGRVCRIFALALAAVSVLLLLGTRALVWVDHRLRCSECSIEDPSGQTWIRAGHAPDHAFAYTDHCACRLKADKADNGCSAGETCVDYGDIDKVMGRCFRRYEAGKCPAAPYWLSPSAMQTPAQASASTRDTRDSMYCPVCLAPVDLDPQTSLSF